MNQNLKAVLITVVVMGVLLGSLMGMSAIKKYEKSLNPPEPYDTGVCYPQYENCSGMVKSAEQQKSFNDWIKSQSPRP